MAVTEQEAELMARVTEEMIKFGKLMPETAAAMALMKAGFSNAVPAVKQFGDAAKSAGKLFSEATSAIGKNSASMDAWSGTLDSAAGAAKGVANGMMLLAKVNPVVAFGLNKLAGAAYDYAKASTAQSDRLFKTFQDISRFGGASAEGLQGVYRDAQRFGITTKELDKYVGLVAENSKELAALGGTVGQGLKDISAVSGAMEGYREGLYKAGMTQQEVNEGLMGYIRLQTRTGMIQRQTTDQLAAGAAKYLIEQEALTKVTGISRKEQEAAREKVAMMDEYNALMIRLQKEGVEGQKKAALIDQTLRGLGADQAEALIAAMTNNMANEKLQQQFRLTQGEIQRIGSDLLAGNVQTSAESLGRFQKSVQVGLDAFSEQGAFGNFSKNFGNMQEAYKLSITAAGDLGKALGKAAEDMDKGGVMGKKAQDAELERQAVTMKAAQDAAKSLDDFSRVLAEPATAAIKGVERGIMSLTTLLPGAGRTAAGGVPLFNTSRAGSAVQPTPPLPTPAIAPAAGAPTTVAPPAAAMPAPAPAAGKAGALAPGFNQQSFLQKMSAGGITDQTAQRNILAQIAAESGGVAKSENLNYSPKRLLELFPKYIKDLDDARALIKQGPEAIGNRIYGGRMGNTATEGFMYRGRGLIQLTGKANYEKYGKMIGVDLVNNPDLANDPEVAQMLAVAYFRDKQQKGVNLSDIGQIGKAVGYVDINGAETAKREQIAKSLSIDAPQAADGAIFSGPSSGYAARLHGTEAVVPLDSDLTDTIKTIRDDLSNTTGQILVAMQEMLRAQRDNVDVNRKMLVASQ